MLRKTFTVDNDLIFISTRRLIHFYQRNKLPVRNKHINRFDQSRIAWIFVCVGIPGLQENTVFTGRKERIIDANAKVRDIVIISILG